jgi:flagellin-specific chaperone FliS
MIRNTSEDGPSASTDQLLVKYSDLILKSKYANLKIIINPDKFEGESIAIATELTNILNTINDTVKIKPNLKELYSEFFRELIKNDLTELDTVKLNNLLIIFKKYNDTILASNNNISELTSPNN